MTRSVEGRILRRNNAPVRPPRPATTVPDLLFACAATAWTMTVVIMIASYVDPDVDDSAGRMLARFFAGTLFTAGMFMFALGYGLLRGEKNQRDHYVFPMALGVFVGLLESIVFFMPAERLLFAPFLLLVFALRPVRRYVSRLVGPGRAARR